MINDVEGKNRVGLHTVYNFSISRQIFQQEIHAIDPSRSPYGTRTEGSFRRSSDLQPWTKFISNTEEEILKHLKRRR